MYPVYHLVTPLKWQAAAGGPYRADSLEREGFIHCSHAEQVAGSANRFYGEAPELLLLVLDPARLTSPLENEPARNGELFPHIYGPINREAVVEVIALGRDETGRWTFSSGGDHSKL